MAEEYISIKRHLADGSSGASTLVIEDGSRALRVMGNLPHGSHIEPANLDEAARIGRWLVDWIEQEVL